MKKFIKMLIPPIFIVTIKKIKRNKYGWKGNYKSWKEAEKYTGGYDSENILEIVKKSSLKVKNGEAAYERDSVIFNKITYSWPLLSSLLLSSLKLGKLKVLDFGGSLGSTYYQNKKFIDKIEEVSWSIVEQKHFVDIGKKDFEDKRLKFYYDVEECVKNETPNMLLLSSVLQYIENPYDLLDSILEYDFEYIVLDRTPFSLDDQDKIKIQIVPEEIYEASYPCWFFNEKKLLSFFIRKGYKMIENFDALDGKSNEYYFKGLILTKL